MIRAVIDCGTRCRARLEDAGHTDLSLIGSIEVRPLLSPVFKNNIGVTSP